jgi:hypothetical protein
MKRYTPQGLCAVSAMRKARLLALMVTAVAVAAAAIGGAGTAPSAAATSCTLPAGNAAQQWDEIAQTIVVGAGPFQNEGLIYMAYANGAVYDAVTSILGGYRPVGPRIPVLVNASADAGVAAAASETLTYYFPVQAQLLQCYRDLALAAVPDGVAKTAGIAVGHAAAANTIAGRIGDGRLPIGTIMPSFPAAGPGVWQPTPPAFAPPQTPWVGDVHPFVLETPDQFLPPPPPALDTRAWARDFNEVQLWGRASGSPRTQEQTDIARFWSTNVISQYNRAFRDIATQHGLDLLETARLIGEASLVAADAQIACMDAKYHYWFWRPVTAINATDPAVTDGNQRTVEEAGTWSPLLTTPNHPEYPAAHGCLTSAMAEVFSDFLGTDAIDVTLTSTVVPTMSSRHFASAQDLRYEIVEARLWGGLHYRNSSEQGVKLGRRVARYDLTHAFKAAEHDRSEHDH